MVYFLSIFLLCLAPNLDNMVIGLAYGARKINVPFRSNFAIALFSGIATLLSSLLGSALANYIPSYTGNIIGGSIVGIMGLYTIIGHLIKNKKSTGNEYQNGNQYIVELRHVMDDPGIADKDYSGDISLKESILLGIALAVNCLGTGFGAGMTGVNIAVLTTAVIIFSLTTISLGAVIGRRWAAKFLGDQATILSGLLLLAVGIYQILF
ncbi:sporulation membrane protein YtaF [Ruminiclostridium cellobioparum]|uniref:Putative sporulation protein YtaF n=1 Tax=Ruminiclostridium cellobioparum subsp. termitidis CT1112 TaxID=1195236 RepID=S0FGT3_RUMCE|nr:sporulation membrane protein YtaF [Ruminiclostridium cellobioparum]EMS68966.1 putative sporulation protein YtaF [Ruminiclostridium cellobioparum subsp. termitidis CT1112]